MSARRVLFASCVVAVLAALGTIQAKPRAPKGTRYAFLVAAADYDRDSDLRKLNFTRNDIVAFHEVLLKSGYQADNVILLHDKQDNRRFLPEVKKIRKELVLLLATLQPEDEVVVAFSGHGVQFAGENKNYFCPVDARLDDRDTLIGMDEVYKQLEACQARRKLLLVDACRNDPQTKQGKSRDRVNLKSLAEPQRGDVPRGIVALFSCSPTQESFEDEELKHSVFFYHVLKAWQGEVGKSADGLSLDELIGYVKTETARYARLKLERVQVPVQKGEFSGVWVLTGETRRELSKEHAGAIRTRLQLTVDPANCKVYRLDPGSTAGKAGIKTGDIIVTYDGGRVNSGEELASAVMSKKGGGDVLVRVNRTAYRQEVRVRLVGTEEKREEKYIVNVPVTETLEIKVAAP